MLDSEFSSHFNHDFSSYHICQYHCYRPEDHQYYHIPRNHDNNYFYYNHSLQSSKHSYNNNYHHPQEQLQPKKICLKEQFSKHSINITYKNLLHIDIHNHQTQPR